MKKWIGLRNWINTFETRWSMEFIIRYMFIKKMELEDPNHVYWPNIPVLQYRLKFMQFPKKKHPWSWTSPSFQLTHTWPSNHDDSWPQQTVGTSTVVKNGRIGTRPSPSTRRLAICLTLKVGIIWWPVVLNYTGIYLPWKVRYLFVGMVWRGCFFFPYYLGEWVWDEGRAHKNGESWNLNQPGFTPSKKLTHMAHLSRGQQPEYHLLQTCPCLDNHDDHAIVPWSR